MLRVIGDEQSRIGRIGQVLAKRPSSISLIVLLVKTG